MLKTGDLRLISQLRQDARQTLTDISRKTRMPISTLYDKLRMHEESIITKHTTLLDFAKLGYNCRASILLRAAKDERDKLIGFLRTNPVINNLYKINNGYDVLAEMIFANVKELEEFLDALDKKFNIEEKKTHYIIEDLKREEFLMDAV